MNPDDFKKSNTGKLVPTIKGMAFVPHPLPPPLLDMGLLAPPLARANKALGELSGIGRTLQNPLLLIRPFMRKEAVASSKIEGTVTTLDQLFLFEVDEASPTPSDAREVFNYVRALEYALKQLEELPVSSRLIKGAHKILLSRVEKHRGSAIVPGEFRSDQNWIGARTIENARYVPPPPNHVIEGMSDLEKYINATGNDDLPLLINLAMIHYQFEAIHPFPDGNGRVGRLLIPLILCERKELSQPLLYLSNYFEKNYQDYIDHMLTVSTHGLWGRWIEFFLDGVEQSCLETIETAQRLLDLQKQYRETIQKARSSALLGRLIDLLFEHPTITVPYAAEKLSITYNAAKNNIDRLVEHQILRDAKGDHRPKFYFADGIISIMS